MKQFTLFVLLAISGLPQLYAQVINGTVTDKQGQALPGANVVLKDTQLGTVTDADGQFVFSGLKHGSYTLAVSFVGYEAYGKVVEVSAAAAASVKVQLDEQAVVTEDVVVTAIRASANTPTTFTTVDKDAIQEQNLGQDVPYLLSSQPSTVVSSDAGAGVGYTSMRIRGVHPSKINVTINGVPLNDSESHGVFWVDVPDIAGSSHSIQVQRGVGSSTNGSGAYGGSINLATDKISKEKYVQVDGSGGSYNTIKMSAAAGSGLIKDHYFVEGKVSRAKSDGYRERAWSDLWAYFGQAGYISDKTIIKAVAFGGWEETYQAWYGLDSASIQANGRRYNPAGALYNDDWSKVVSFYDNFIDHYQQDHQQLQVVQELGANLSGNVTFHHTYGRGYYEDMWQGMDRHFHGLDTLVEGNVLTHSTIAHRLWLDNHFYGATWGLNYKTKSLEASLGGGYHKYANAKHFGEVVGGDFVDGYKLKDRFYENEGNKTDFNVFAKAVYTLGKVSLYGDMQARTIDYRATGTNREWTDALVDIDENYFFLNPKTGVSYEYAKGGKLYASYAIAHREPTRGDFINAEDGVEPKPEQLNDFELGIKHSTPMFVAEAVLYNMKYKDQLALTGQLDNVGAPIRRNNGSSIRRGVELIAGLKPLVKLELSANLTLSQNQTSYKTLNDDGSFTDYKDMQLAFSPNVIAGGKVQYLPLEQLRVAVLFKHVGKQFVDNSEQDVRRLDAYSVFDLQANYKFVLGRVEGSFNLMVMNLAGTEYNGYGAVGYYGSTEYYPQATRHFLVGCSLRL